MTNSDEPTGSVAPGVSRRRFLQATGLGAAAAAAAGLSGGPAAAADSSAALPAGWSGTIRDVKHVVILMQENRSFDHQLPPFPEATVTDEFIGGLPIGPGNRVPMIICSPWTRGGYVDSNVYDHTSVLQYLAT